MSARDTICNIFKYITKLDLELLPETSADIFIETFKDDNETSAYKATNYTFFKLHNENLFTIKFPSKYFVKLRENNLKEVFPRTFISLILHLTLSI